jgi:hypothetical protein
MISSGKTDESMRYALYWIQESVRKHIPFPTMFEKVSLFFVRLAVSSIHVSMEVCSGATFASSFFSRGQCKRICRCKFNVLFM